MKTYRDVALEYEFHLESKCADTHGNPCSKQTIGLLERRHIRTDQIKYIGKESNRLEEVESGLVHSEQNPSAEAEYEVHVIDGFQRFREYPDGKKELENVPLPSLNTVFAPAGEWSELPQMVGTELKLKIHQMPGVVVNERRVKVFQYQASVEDGLCRWDIGVDYGFFATSKIFNTAAYGEVWTDEDMNILRISEHCEIPEKFKWKDFWAVVTYGWLKRADEPPRLIPLTIYAQAEHKKRMYWCRGQFTNYEMFTTRAKIIPAEDTKAGLPHSKLP